MRWSSRRWLVSLPLLLALGAGAIWWTQHRQTTDSGDDFTLTDHNNATFELTSLRGKVVLVFFGYSMCPDVCPTTLSKLSSVSRRLGDDRAIVKTLYITVDPERDTPAVLKADLQNFDLDAIGLTGTKAEIDRVVGMFGASYQLVPTPSSAGRYSVSHSTSLYVLDTTGQVRRELPYEASVEEIVESIRAVRDIGPRNQ